VSDDALPLGDWFSSLRRRLRAWFDRHSRDLPWRADAEPYAIWLSEVMLQQTTVATVLPRYARFLQRFPSLASLAAADEDDVLHQWEGLGYYRRARQLHKAARVIVAEHGGRFPDQFAVVRGLPGIGRYTAGAILSFAFDQPWPILEANTTRLWARLLACDEPSTPQGQRRLWSAAEAVLPKRTGSRTINLALMDIGATICTPREPRCEECPLAALCLARRQGRQREVPQPKRAALPTAVREAAVVVRRRGRVLLMRYPVGQRWAGLWDFPRFAVTTTKPAALRRELAENVERLTGVAIAPGEHLTTIKHSVTRYRITLQCFAASCVDGASGRTGLHETRWVSLDELDAYALHTTGRKLARLLSDGKAKGR
jgi:A/G-specific adenine glycosylase